MSKEVDQYSPEITDNRCDKISMGDISIHLCIKPSHITIPVNYNKYDLIQIEILHNSAIIIFKIWGNIGKNVLLRAHIYEYALINFPSNYTVTLGASSIHEQIPVYPKHICVQCWTEQLGKDHQSKHTIGQHRVTKTE